MLRPNHPRPQPITTRLGDVHQGELAGVCHLPGVFHSSRSPETSPLRAVVRGWNVQSARVLTGGDVFVLPARMFGPVPLPLHVQVCRLQSLLQTLQRQEPEHLFLKLTCICSKTAFSLDFTAEEEGHCLCLESKTKDCEKQANELT